MQVPKSSRTQTSRPARRTQEAARNLRTLSMAAVLLLMIFALGCADSVPTAVEDHATAEADVAATLSKGKPTDTGIITRATFTGASVCGIPVTADVVETGTKRGSFFLGIPEKRTGFQRVTFTTEDGKAVQTQTTGLRIQEVTQIDQNTFRVIRTFLGAIDVLSIPNGPLLSLNAGRSVSSFVAEQQEDGSFIRRDFEILELSGRSPAAESGFTMFCEVVTDALT